MKQSSKIFVVVGPTASGKSDFAVELALTHNGEIISADSRQVYKGLDIGTGKITEEEMKGIKHHMLSVYELGAEVRVARFARAASPTIEAILKRGKTPIICGGTGQYIDALIYNTSLPKVPPNKTLRERLEKLTTNELYTKLADLDPKRAEKIDIHNRVRLIRALEITESLGAVPQLATPELKYDTTLYLLAPTRELLRTRITKRLEKRIAAGMVEAVKTILKKIKTLYGQSSDTETKKLGLEYVSIGKFLDNTLSEEDMKKEIITKSCQYAKRQETWNKKYLPIAEIISVKK